MVKRTLVNVGEVDVETLDDVMGEPLEATPYDGTVVNSESDEETQEQAEEEALENISESDKEKQLKRERNSLKRDVGKIGAAYGAGKVSMIALAERVTEAAMTGSIKPTDAEWIYDEFKAKGDDKATLDDAGVVPDAALLGEIEKPAKDSKKQQVSKVRGFIKLGNEFEEDAAAIVRTARNVHLRMIETQDRKTIMKGSTYSILVQVASKQLSTEQKGIPLTEAEIETYLTVDARKKPPPDGVEKIEGALNSARAARDGSKDGTRAPIDNDNLNLAIEHLRTALGELAPDRLQALDAKHHKSDDAAPIDAPASPTQEAPPAA